MSKFEVNILGCGSALPTLRHNPTSQVVNVRDNLFMIDCGEGTQLAFRKQRLKFSRLNQIFISHLHGDHCFGLIGLISTLGLLGRTGDLVIHAHKDLETILQPQLDYFCRLNPFKVIFKAFDPTKHELIYEDRSITVHTIPLAHRVPCAGFLFTEKQREPNLDKEKIKFYELSVKDILKVKNGEDITLGNGKVISNATFVKEVHQPKSYAYCSDTAYLESIVDIIKNADLLYHEATFQSDNSARAKETGHSTASEAAMIAKLANVKELMIGHFSSRYDDHSTLLQEAKTIFEKTILANEELCKKV